MGWWHLRRLASAPSIGAAAACGALAAALAGGCTGGAREPRPDRIALVAIDTLRADRLGSFGAHGARTPHLDARGVRHNGLHRLAVAFPTLTESLHAAGYATAAFVGARVLERRFGLARGFDLYDAYGRAAPAAQ